MNNSALFIGIHTGHDANVTVIDEQGTIRFAAGEERFNRKKMYAGFPGNALKYVLSQIGTDFQHVAAPRMDTLPKLIRELAFAAHSLRHGIAAPRFGVQIRHGITKLFRGRSMEKGEQHHSISLDAPTINIEHHDAHAASAFYPSGFKDAYIMTLDGEGDGFSCCLYSAKNKSIRRFKSFYHNEVTIGRDYETVTAMLGFNPIRHPGKVTGLAAFGTHNESCIDKLSAYLEQNWKTQRFRALSTGKAFQVISDEGCRELIEDRETIFSEFSREDMAYAIQYLTEQRVLEIINKWIPDIQGANLALAGGVFANVALNKKIKELGVAEVFIQPAMTDAGLSLGALLESVKYNFDPAPFTHVYFGPSYSPDAIKSILEKTGLTFSTPENPPLEVARLLADGKVVARFDGRMEFGPRALGNRSILYRADDPSVNDWLNKKLNRTEFMPFAPVTLEQFAPDYYENISGAERAAKFMTMTFACTEKMKRESPAVVHVDGTARPQLISAEDNPGYAAVLEEYYQLTGIPTLVNTSFNMHEEPIVMTPWDAVRAFSASALDALLIGPYLVVQ